jgi:EmrB/QacA subfamily drug resistance transporter
MAAEASAGGQATGHPTGPPAWPRAPGDDAGRAAPGDGGVPALTTSSGGAEVVDARTGRWVLVAAILGSSMAFIDSTAVNVALPALQRDLGATVGDVQWVVEGYALMLAALLLVGGALGDRYGRRVIFAAGAAGFAVASAACGLAPGTGWLIAARAAQGASAALLVPGSLAILSAAFPPADRGRAIGTWSGFSGFTASIGPLLGGWLIDHASWRWVFFLNLPIAAAVLVLVAWRVPESRDPEAAPHLDGWGALLATLGLGGVTYGLIELPRQGAGHIAAVAALAGGIAALAGFVAVEARSPAPMMPLGLFRSRNFAGANLLTLCLYAALGGTLFFLPFNLIQVQGYTAAAAGAAMLPFVLPMVLLSRAAGAAASRFGPRPPLVAGTAVAAAGFALLAVPAIPGTAGYWSSYFPAMLVLGLGMTASIVPLTTTVMDAVETRHAGLASGVNNAVSRMASLLAVAAFGLAVLAAFDRGLDRRLAALDLPAQARTAISVQRLRLAAAEVPRDLDPRRRAAARQAIDLSFIAGFRLAMLAGAGLALLSSLTAAVMIDRQPGAHRPDDARTAAPPSAPRHAAERGGLA